MAKFTVTVFETTEQYDGGGVGWYWYATIHDVETGLAGDRYGQPKFLKQGKRLLALGVSAGDIIEFDAEFSKSEFFDPNQTFVNVKNVRFVAKVGA